MSKFTLGTEVYIKALDKRGHVNAITTHYNASGLSHDYQVTYKDGFHMLDHGWGSVEAVANKWISVSVKEEDICTIEEIEDAAIAAIANHGGNNFKSYVDMAKPNYDHAIDALRYLAFNKAAIGVDMTKLKTCEHKWKLYDSGFSRYEYCEYPECDLKRNV